MVGYFGVVDLDCNDCVFGGVWLMDVVFSFVFVFLYMIDDVCLIGYVFVGVDGGVCNNEFFEYVWFCLREKDEIYFEKLKDNLCKFDEVICVVIMIDLFFEGFEIKLFLVLVDDG